MKVVFAGTAAFAVPTLNAIHDSRHGIVLVVTQPDHPAGRGLRLTASPIKQAADRAQLDVFQPERIREAGALERIRAAGPDSLVVVAYGQILPAALLAVPTFGALNLHASLLPRHRGPAPIAWAILSGDQETGVTVMQMGAGVDTGPILAQRRVSIHPTERADQLEARLARIGADLMVETLDALERGAVRPRPQPADGATQAPRLQSHDGRLRADMAATEIDRRVRALGRSPGCWITLPQGEVKVLAGHLEDGQAATPDGIRLQTADGTYVIDEVQPAGGRPMSAAAWARGRR